MVSVRRSCIGVCLSGLVVFTGCGPRSLYDWGGYNSSLHRLYNEPGEFDVDSEIEHLASEIGETPPFRIPPGKAAHVGLLCSMKGDIAQATRFFELEKRLFPESEPLMTRLIQRAGGAGGVR